MSDLDTKLLGRTRAILILLIWIVVFLVTTEVIRSSRNDSNQAQLRQVIREEVVRATREGQW